MTNSGLAGRWSRLWRIGRSVGAIMVPMLLGCSTPMSGGGAQAMVARVDRGSHAGAEGTRAWRIFVPAKIEQPASMLVLLHGCLQDAADIAAGSGMDAVASREGFVVLYPEQDVAANPRKCWNWFDPAHQTRGAGEPAILAGMIAEAARAHHIDANRVHIAGISAGAAMAGLMAAAYPERFASVSIMSGVAWKSASNVGRALAVMKDGAGASVQPAAEMVAAMGANARAVPTLVLHGTSDAVLNVRNGDEAAAQSVALHELLRARAGLGPLRHVAAASRTEGGYGVTEDTWRDERGSAQVMFVRVVGLGHAWSGGLPAGTFTDSAGPNASDVIARFISQHGSAHR